MDEETTNNNSSSSEVKHTGKMSTRYGNKRPSDDNCDGGSDTEKEEQQITPKKKRGRKAAATKQISNPSTSVATTSSFIHPPNSQVEELNRRMETIETMVYNLQESINDIKNAMIQSKLLQYVYIVSVSKPHFLDYL